ncbi:MAG: InlB B-repeat-containing protein [Bacteroidales bacterium]|jgi:uncharacterized repeat protein (TIGR02543 family)|nr:InlB B-repeat-containing protein [Bacteroidales bacterium]
MKPKILILLLTFPMFFHAQGIKHTLHNGGGRPDSENVVFTILGDGFTAADQHVFLNRARRITIEILDRYPFSHFKDRMNIYAIEVNSPSISNGYFGYTRGGSAWPGASPDTAYKGDRVRSVLATHTPKVDILSIYCNSTSTGGWGAAGLSGVAPGISLGALGITGNTPRPDDTINLLLHEMGHSFGDLWDEYEAEGAGNSERANYTRDTNRWKAWVGVENVGLHTFYANRNKAGWYVPGPVATWENPNIPSQCIMRGTGGQKDFCLVCAAAQTRLMAALTGEVYMANGAITTADIPHGHTRIVDGAFLGCSDLRVVNIAGSVAEIGDYAFLRCTMLNTITNFAETPQPLNTKVFYGVDNLSAIKLRVPSGSVAAYRAAPIWKEFNIVAIPDEVGEPIIVETSMAISRLRVNTWSTSGSDAFAQSKLTDGNPMTYWHGNYGSGSGHQGGEGFVDIDLGSVKTVSEIRFDKRIGYGVPSIKAVRILKHDATGNTFPNGETMSSYTAANVSQTQINADFAMTGWTEVGAKAAGLADWGLLNQAVFLKLDEPITTRYIRLGVTQAGNNYAQVSAIRIAGYTTIFVAPEITTTTLPNGAVGVNYVTQTLTATGSTPIWSIVDGDLPPGLTFTSATAEISGTPTAEGTYTFTVRAENREGSDTQALSIVIAERPTYTVTFNSNGGSAVDSETVAHGEKITEPDDPTREGYTFVGWYTDTTFAQAWNFNTGIVMKDTTLFAKWTAIISNLVDMDTQTAFLRVHPNPIMNGTIVILSEAKDLTANGSLTAFGMTTQIEIFDMTGKRVYSHPAPRAPHPAPFSIDISHLPNGTYILKIGTNSVKIVK